MKKIIFVLSILTLFFSQSFACSHYGTCHDDGRVHGCHGGGQCDSMDEKLGE